MAVITSRDGTRRHAFRNCTLTARHNDVYNPQRSKERGSRMRKLLFAAAVLFVCFVGANTEAQCLLTFQTEVVEPFFVNTPGNFQFIAVSGTEPYKYEVFGDTLPEPFKLTTNGKLIAKPEVEMEFVLFVTVTDAAGCHLTQAFNVVVFPESGPPV
jgi:hypothetical protein